MFEPFCGLSGHPFELRPDPAFYFPSRGHQRAGRRLEYGLRHGGLTVLTGEHGVGKTTTLELFLRHLAGSAVTARKLDASRLNGEDLIAAAAGAFADARPAGAQQRLLILDEAQGLPPKSWHDLLRLPFQVFVVGRPELRQRVSSYCHLEPLEPDETPAYIEHRLRQVGWEGDAPFDDDAFALIHFHTRGIPRQINSLCARALAGVVPSEWGPVSAHAVSRLIQGA